MTERDRIVQKSYSFVGHVEFLMDPEVDPFYWVNEAGEKQWRMEGIYSDITTEDEVWKHLAYNAVINGVDDVSRLDGWGDLTHGQFKMWVDGSIEEEL